MEGVIKTLTDKGFGFITVDEKADSQKGPNAVNVKRI